MPVQTDVEVQQVEESFPYCAGKLYEQDNSSRKGLRADKPTFIGLGDRLKNIGTFMKLYLTPFFLLTVGLVGSGGQAANDNGANTTKDTVVGDKDIVVGDFETATYGQWVTMGTAFGSGPARGAHLPQLEIRGARGDGAASSELEGDRSKGTLTSPFFKIERNYLSFVIGGGDYEHHACLNVLVDGQVVRSATGYNTDNLRPVSWDMRRFLGKTAQVQIVDEASGQWGHVNVDHILQTNRPERLPVTTQPLYQETYRPQFHFTARQWTEDRLNPGMRQEGWLNDLNGLIYYEGEYHLFAQRWNKCWIHAVSRDLVHWTELQPAFWEEQLDSGVQSGTCVVDYNNSSGLSPDPKNPPMVAFWSRNDNRSQCMSYSLDKGRTWKHYAKNPLMVKPERDPKVFWYEPSHHWVMMLYGGEQYHILTSTNLLDWHDEGHPIPNSFECPDFFQLLVDGDRNNVKWVLVRGNGKYSVGTFDGTQFHEETEQFTSDAGPNFYATQTFGNVEHGDGRRIQLAWMNGGAYPDMPFNQQVTFPRELTLRSTPNGLRLFRVPVREIALLHQRENTWANRALGDDQELTLAPSGDSFHLKMAVSIPAGVTLTLNVRGVPVVLTHQSFSNGTDPVSVAGELKTIEVLVDRTSVEVFANGGEVSSACCFLPGGEGLSLKATGGQVMVQSLSIFQLNSMWQTGANLNTSAK